MSEQNLIDRIQEGLFDLSARSCLAWHRSCRLDGSKIWYPTTKTKDKRK